MKRTLNILALAAVLALAGACGKNKSSDSSSSLRNVSKALSPSSAQAVVNYQNWYRSVTEGQGGLGVYTVDRRSYTASYGNGCEVDDIEIFGVVIGQWYNCSNLNTMSGGTSSTCRAVVTLDYNDSVKHLNPTLAAIHTGAAGIIVEAIQSGSVFTLQIQKPSGYIVSYVIDTNYHSAFQPLQVTDFEAGTVVKRVNVMYGANPSLPVCPAI